MYFRGESIGDKGVFHECCNQLLQLNGVTPVYYLTALPPISAWVSIGYHHLLGRANGAVLPPGLFRKSLFASPKFERLCAFFSHGFLHSQSIFKISNMCKALGPNSKQNKPPNQKQHQTKSKRSSILKSFLHPIPSHHSFLLLYFSSF